MALGLVVRDLRKGAGLSQEDLAHAAGVTRNHIQRIEHATTFIAFDALVRMAAGLDRNPRELLKDAEKLVHQPELMTAALRRLDDERKRGRPRK